MISFVNAKINLGLRVVERLPSGYHRLETIFYPVGLYNGTPECPYPLCDILEATPSKEFSLEQSGEQATSDPCDNLVYKAWELFSEYCHSHRKQVSPFVMRLEKHLPMQAGMGGGSADASFALRLYNHLNGNLLSDEELKSLALKIGADCPFFLLNKPALAGGIGEELIPLAERLKGMWCAIAKPAENMSTKEAFARITPSGKENELETIYKGEMAEWRTLMENDFEEPFFALYPHCRKIKERFYDSGALYSSLSGSGGAFYALFPDHDSALAALHRQTTPYKALALL